MAQANHYFEGGTLDGQTIAIEEQPAGADLHWHQTVVAGTRYFYEKTAALNGGNPVMALAASIAEATLAAQSDGLQALDSVDVADYAGDSQAAQDAISNLLSMLQARVPPFADVNYGSWAPYQTAATCVDPRLANSIVWPTAPSSVMNFKLSGPGVTAGQFWWHVVGVVKTTATGCLFIAGPPAARWKWSVGVVGSTGEVLRPHAWLPNFYILNQFAVYDPGTKTFRFSLPNETRTKG